MGGVDVVRDGNKTDPISGEHPTQVASGFDVLSSQAGEVLHNDAVDLAMVMSCIISLNADGQKMIPL